MFICYLFSGGVFIEKVRKTGLAFSSSLENWHNGCIIVLIITKLNHHLNIEGLEKLRGVLEECEYKELKMKLGFKDTDLPDQYFYNKAASASYRMNQKPWE